MTNAAPETGAAPEPPPPAAETAPSALDSLRSIWRELPGLLSDRVEILALELRRAGSVLAQIVVLVVAAAILAVTAWLVLWGGIVVALVSAGMHTALALLGAVLINLGAATWAVTRARHLVPLLSLPVTKRHLTTGPAAMPGSVDSPTSPPAGPPHEPFDPATAGPSVAR